MKLVLALQALVVTIVQLAENDDDWAGFLKMYLELRVEVVYAPRYVDAGPLLRHRPLWPEESSAIEVLVVPKQVPIGNPEDTIIAEFVVKLLHPFRRPLLGAVAPPTRPLGPTPGIAEFK